MSILMRIMVLGDGDEDCQQMLLGPTEILVQIVPGNKLAHPIQSQFLTLVAVGTLPTVGCPFIKCSQTPKCLQFALILHL